MPEGARPRAAGNGGACLVIPLRGLPREAPPHTSLRHQREQGSSSCACTRGHNLASVKHSAKATPTC